MQSTQRLTEGDGGVRVALMVIAAGKEKNTRVRP